MAGISSTTDNGPLATDKRGGCTLRLVVQKFGGTSVANAERVMAAARRAIRAKQAGNQVIVVVSARGDTTDELISLAREITEQPPPREMDMLLSTGEPISTARMRQAVDEGKIVIVAGFQGIDEQYNITTLGRGGSDTTAVALAAVMKHSSGVRGQESGVRNQESGA